MTGVVLDASAILAAILGEPGGDEVFGRLETAAVGAVNAAEVYTYAAINGLSPEAIDTFFADTGIEAIGLDLSQARRAGLMAAQTRKAGLSLADRACLTLGAMRGDPVLTADRAWLAVAGDLGIEVELLR